MVLIRHCIGTILGRTMLLPWQLRCVGRLGLPFVWPTYCHRSHTPSLTYLLLPAPALPRPALCSLDTPSAPRLLGRLLGSSVALVGLEAVLKPAKAVESAEPRRNFVAAALLAIKVSQSVAALLGAAAALCLRGKLFCPPQYLMLLEKGGKARMG